MENEVTTGVSNEGEFFIGNPLNFWRFSSKHGFDLTRPRDDQTNASIHLETTTIPILIDPRRSALIIIDMQNFFLHPNVRLHETGLLAATQLLNNVIPAARKVNLQIIWLNWGMTEEDIEQAPPGLKRIFGLHHLEQAMKETANSTGASMRIYTGFGTPMGQIRLSSGEDVDAGRLLMRDSWNAKLYDPLFHSYEQSQISGKPDQWFHKVNLVVFLSIFESFFSNRIEHQVYGLINHRSSHTCIRTI